MQINFSVIIPVYNVAAYVRLCVESVIKQNYSKLEIILIDDYSTDDSRQICEQLAMQYKQVSLLQHPINRGLGATRNTGILAVRGEYVIFLDSDDVMYPGYLTELNQKIIDMHHPEIIVTAPFVYNHCSQYIFSWMDEQKTRTIPHDTLLNANQYPELYFLEVSACSKVYNSKYLLDSKIQFPERLKFEDFVFHFKILSQAQYVVVTNLHSFYYRICRGNQITSDVGKTRKDILVVNLQVYEYLLKHQVPLEVFRYYFKWALQFQIWGISIINSEHFTEFANMMHNFWYSVDKVILHHARLSRQELLIIKILRHKILFKLVFNSVTNYTVLLMLTKTAFMQRILGGRQ